MSQITRFEKARLVSARALQLSFGAPPLIKAKPGMSAYDLALEELQEGVLPLTVIRHFPDGRLEKMAV
jgi:DNA-directed RNA polymerase subunit K/omega